MELVLIGINTWVGDFTRVGRLVVAGVGGVIAEEFGGSVGSGCLVASVCARLHEARVHDHVPVRTLEYQPTTHLLPATRSSHNNLFYQ